MKRLFRILTQRKRFALYYRRTHSARDDYKIG